MCTSAPRGTNNAARASRKDAVTRAAASRQRQPRRLVIHPVSTGLARVELTGPGYSATLRKRNIMAGQRQLEHAR